MNYNSSRLKETSIVALSFLCLLSAIGCMLLGYIFLPVAAGIYAALILAEKKKRIVVSYIIPIVTLVANFFLNGVYSIEGGAYAAIGVLIYLLYQKSKSKGESAFWLTLVVILMMIISASLIALEQMADLNFSSIYSFYSDLYITQKEKFLDFALAISTKNENNIVVYPYNASVAEALFIDAVKLLFPILICFSFLIVGVSLKIFSKQAAHHVDERNKVSEWDFRPSSIVAYFYLIVFLISCFVTEGIFAESVMWINLVFSLVFAYMGIKFFRYLFSQTRAGAFAIIITIAVVFLMPSLAFNLLTFLGVFFTISSNNRSSVNNSL